MGRPKGSKNKPKKDAPKRKYTRRAPTQGGTRSGAGRKSIEVHLSALRADITAQVHMQTMLLANAIGVGDQFRAALATLPVPVAPAPAPVAAAPVTNGPGSISETSAPPPLKRKPGRPRKIVTPAEPIEKVPTRQLADDQPAPVFTQPAPVTPAPAQVVPQAPVMQAPLAPPFAAQPVQVAAPIQFTPPPPVQVAPQFIGVAPVQPLPVQPTANGAPDFDAQFNALPSIKPAGQ